MRKSKFNLLDITIPYSVTTSHLSTNSRYTTDDERTTFPAWYRNQGLIIDKCERMLNQVDLRLDDEEFGVHRKSEVLNAPLDYNGIRKDIKQEIPSEGIKKPLYRFPKPYVRFGDKLINTAYMNDFVLRAREYLFEAITNKKLKPDESDLRYIELDRLSKFSFNYTGVDIPADYLAKTLSSENTVFEKFDDDVVQATVQSYEEHGFSMTKVLNEVVATLALNRSAAFPIRGFGMNEKQNAVAASLSGSWGVEAAISLSHTNFDTLDDKFYRRFPFIPGHTSILQTRKSHHNKTFDMLFVDGHNLKADYTIKKLGKRLRGINLFCADYTAAIKNFAAHMMTAMLSMAWHQTNFVLLAPEFAQNRNDGFTSVMEDLKGAERTIPPKMVNPLFKAISKKQPFFCELFDRISSVPILDFARVEGSAYSLLQLEELSSGDPLTTLKNTIANSTAFRQACKVIYGTPYFEKLRDKVRPYFYGDDSQVFYKNVDDSEKFAEVKRSLGLRPDPLIGSQFLATYTNNRYTTGSVPGFISSLVAPESTKDASILITCGVAAQSDLCKNSPFYKDYVHVANVFLEETKCGEVHSVDACIARANSEAFKTDLIEYGESKGKAANALIDVILKMTQGGSNYREDSNIIKLLYEVAHGANVLDLKGALSVSKKERDYYTEHYLESMTGDLNSIRIIDNYYQKVKQFIIVKDNHSAKIASDDDDDID